MKITVFWFRRDLRLTDNTGLSKALQSGNPVLLLFIFDTNIISELDKSDARITFIIQEITKLNKILKDYNSSVLCVKGDPLIIWHELINQYDISNVFYNKDYEPYAIERDKKVSHILENKGIANYAFKDHVIFEESEVVKQDGKPYTVFTPYKKKWLEKFNQQAHVKDHSSDLKNLVKQKFEIPKLQELGFSQSGIQVEYYDLSKIKDYAQTRDFPFISTTKIGPHLRFGTISIRQVIKAMPDTNVVFLNELIWREFFMQILFHFPMVVDHNFKKKYDGVQWLNNQQDFELWKAGKTGYPFVDAGMRQLNTTGYMHNRARMVAASFLCKHLQIDWRWGEAYFAQRLLDYELSSNNGNWQWAASTGCDAVPYFRIFNPFEQQRKFDKDFNYIRKWVPEFGSNSYPALLVDHDFARERAIETYKKGLSNYKKWG